VSDCCQIETPKGVPPDRCASCGQPGRTLDPITVKALLRPEALARVSSPPHRFCATPSCPVVYFGADDVFRREDIAVPVFQKEASGNRTVCYCFGIGEPDLAREIATTGRSTAAARIAAHVGAGRCACEMRNPEGRCCLGHVVEATKALLDDASQTPTTEGAEDGPGLVRSAQP